MALVVAVLGVWMFAPAPSTVNEESIVNRVIEAVRSFGALSGPDIPSPYLSWGGLQIYQGNMSMRQGTSTVCAIVSPVATSTLSYFGASWAVGSSTSALVAYVSKGADDQSTTTSLDFNTNGIAIASGIKGSFFINGTTTTNGTIALDDTFVIAPSQTVMLTFAGDSEADLAPNNDGRNLTPTGNCTAEFKVLSYQEI